MINHTNRSLGTVWITRIKGPECSTVVGYNDDPRQSSWWKGCSDVWGPWDLDKVEQNDRLAQLIKAGYAFGLDCDNYYWSFSVMHFTSSLEEAIQEAWQHYVSKSDTDN